MPLLKLFSLMLLLYRVYRRLPASQRRRLLQVAGRHGPRIASNAARRLK